jgi:DNA mismatch endonuclease (patch repair protein)
MADVVDPATRSRMMSGIRGKNTRPELMIRRALHARGFRYRLHCKDLPGKPDLCLPKYRAVIFVHGCFWHGHDCHLFKWPKTRAAFWEAKVRRNREVDEAALTRLTAEGWRVATVWECALKGKERLHFEEVIDTLALWLPGNQSALDVRGSHAFSDELAGLDRSVRPA